MRRLSLLLVPSALLLVLMVGLSLPAQGQSGGRKLLVPLVSRNVALGPDLEVLSARSYLDDQGDLHVVGELRNAASWPQSALQVGLQFVDASGATLGSDFGFALVDLVPAGGTAPFDAIVSDPPGGYSEVLLSVEGQSATGAGPAVATEGLVGALQPDGYYRVAGQLRNDSGAGLVDATAVVSLYDAGGALLAAGAVAARPSSLGAGGRGSFELSLLPRGTVASYRVLAQAYPAPRAALARSDERGNDRGGGNGGGRGGQPTAEAAPTQEERGGGRQRTPEASPTGDERGGGRRDRTPTAAAEATPIGTPVPAGASDPTATPRRGGGSGRDREKIGRPESDQSGRGKRDGRDGTASALADRKGPSLKIDWSPRALTGLAAPGGSFSGTVELSAVRGGPAEAQLIVRPASRAAAVRTDGGGGAAPTGSPVASATAAAGTPGAEATGSATATPTGTPTATAASQRAAQQEGTPVDAATVTPTGTAGADATPSPVGTTVPSTGGSSIGTVSIPASGSVSVPITVDVPASHRGARFNAVLFVQVDGHPVGRPLKIRLQTRGGSGGTPSPGASGTPGTETPTTATPASTGTPETATPVSTGTPETATPSPPPETATPAAETPTATPTPAS